MRARLETPGSSSPSFWEVSVDGASTKIRFGTVGGDEVTTLEKRHSSASDAQQAAATGLTQKLAEGYRQTANDGFVLVGANATAAAAVASAKSAALPGAVSAHQLITGGAAMDPVATVLAGTKKKKVGADAIVQLVAALDAGSVTPAAAKPALAACAALFARGDFMKASLAGVRYDGVEKAIDAIIQAAERAHVEGVLPAASLDALASELGSRAVAVRGYDAKNALVAALKRGGAVADAIIGKSIDHVIDTGRAPQSGFLFFHLDPGGSGTTFPWSDATVARLSAAVDPASSAGVKVACGLRALEHKDWIAPGTTHRYMTSAPSVTAAVHALEAAVAAHTLVTHSDSLAGFDENAGTIVSPAARFDGAWGGFILATQAGAPARALAATEQYQPKTLRIVGGKVFSLAENTKQNRVAHVQVHDVTTGAKLGSAVLPRPLHHLKGQSMATDAAGALLYASSESGSQDVLARVTVALDARGKATLTTQHVHVDTTEEDKKHTGFKLHAVTVDGDRALGALHHEGQNALKLIEYALPTLESRALLAEPVPYVGDAGGITQIAATKDRIIVAGKHSIQLFARDATGAKLVGALPVSDVADVRARADGGLDLVVSDRSFTPVAADRQAADGRTWKLVRLPAADVERVFAPFERQR